MVVNRCPHGFGICAIIAMDECRNVNMSDTTAGCAFGNGRIIFKEDIQPNRMIIHEEFARMR